eukprot:COSAG01_NODE_3391_length_6151_cov_4.717944_9_plen_40_part_00
MMCRQRILRARPGAALLDREPRRALAVAAEVWRAEVSIS